MQLLHHTLRSRTFWKAMAKEVRKLVIYLLSMHLGFVISLYLKTKVWDLTPDNLFFITYLVVILAWSLSVIKTYKTVRNEMNL